MRCAWSQRQCRRARHEERSGPVEVIYLLVLISLVLVLVIACVFFWAVKSGQYDDLEGPRHRILADDDSIHGDRLNNNG